MSDTLDNRFHFDRAHVEDLPAISSLAAGTVLGSHRAVPLCVGVTRLSGTSACVQYLLYKTEQQGEVLNHIDT